jgi:hypothetical protein
MLEAEYDGSLFETMPLWLCSLYKTYRCTPYTGVQATPEAESELRVLTNDTILRDNPIPPLENWQQELKRALLTPSRKRTTWTTVYIRLRRNYAYLLLAAYLGWAFKLSTLPGNFDWALFVITTAILFACSLGAYILRPRPTSSAQEFLD